ncbi:hypothetical protein U0070_011930 [Myodes glareolus]|uniref:Uncharacterized protein n=1 Tax=Myodes glareolus TaxID=447135 RepID=A0AAW0HKY0_MYOGA
MSDAKALEDDEEMWFNEDDDEEGKVVVTPIEKSKIEDVFPDSYEKFMETKNAKESKDKENLSKRTAANGTSSSNNKSVVAQTAPASSNGSSSKIANLAASVTATKDSDIGGNHVVQIVFEDLPGFHDLLTLILHADAHHDPEEILSFFLKLSVPHPHWTQGEQVTLLNFWKALNVEVLASSKVNQYLTSAKSLLYWPQELVANENSEAQVLYSPGCALQLQSYTTISAEQSKQEKRVWTRKHPVEMITEKEPNEKKHGFPSMFQAPYWEHEKVCYDVKRIPTGGTLSPALTLMLLSHLR